jgi:hypothetical protein
MTIATRDLCAENFTKAWSEFNTKEFEASYFMQKPIPLKT